jgi:hypothetical protein
LVLTLKEVSELENFLEASAETVGLIVHEENLKMKKINKLLKVRTRRRLQGKKLKSC